MSSFFIFSMACIARFAFSRRSTVAGTAKPRDTSAAKYRVPWQYSTQLLSRKPLLLLPEHLLFVLQGVFVNGDILLAIARQISKTRDIAWI